MSMLARYKKQGGIIELVKLIESSSEPKRSSLLKMVRSEDAAFADEVESKIFSFAKLKLLPENVIAEIVGATPPKYLALSLFGEDAEFIKLCEKCVGKNFAEYKSEKDAIEGTAVTPAQVESGQRKMIGEARKLEAAGNIKLGSSQVGAPTTGDALRVTPEERAAANAAAAGGGAAPSGDALKDLAIPGVAGGPPPIASFAMEPPPAGLIGERLETYIKQTLGV